MEDFFDRLDKYMVFKELNDNQMTVKAGLSIGSLGKQRRGSRGLSSDSIAKILISCSDLSAEWLLIGKGSMLKEQKKSHDIEHQLEESKTNYYKPPPCEKCKLKDQLIESQRREIETQAQFIKHLQETSPQQAGQKRKGPSSAYGNDRMSEAG